MIFDFFLARDGLWPLDFRINCLVVTIVYIETFDTVQRRVVLLLQSTEHALKVLRLVVNLIR